MNSVFHVSNPVRSNSKRSVLKARRRIALKQKRKQQKLRDNESFKPPIYTAGYLERIRQDFLKPPQTVVPIDYFSSIFNAYRIAHMLRCSGTSIAQSLLYLTANDVSPIFKQHYEDTCKDYLMERKFRGIFRRLLCRWRIKRIDAKPQDLIDPITFMPIEQLVTVYDMEQRRKYCFDALTLVKCVTKDLFRQQYTIPSPQMPKNVVTNKPFKFQQLISLQRQLAYLPQATYLSYFRKVGFCLNQWRLYMGRTLRLSAIKEELHDTRSFDGKEMLGDFIKDTMVEIGMVLTDHFEQVIIDAIEWYPDNPLLARLRHLCFLSHEAHIYRVDNQQMLLHMFDATFRKTYPDGPLWKQVGQRQYEESEAVRREEEVEMDD
uniref:Uncharacterized protein n=1 Tax=viral metagenome TaxID=1070528 RepID=A0A6C0AP92_9ZZZZ